jgi:hypothetical protein
MSWIMGKRYEIIYRGEITDDFYKIAGQIMSMEMNCFVVRLKEGRRVIPICNIVHMEEIEL